MKRVNTPYIAEGPSSTGRRSNHFMQGFISDMALFGMMNSAVREVLVDDDHLLTDGTVIEHKADEFKEG